MASIGTHPQGRHRLLLVLYRHNGKQTSATYYTPDDAERGKALIEQVGPTKALEIMGADERVSGEQTVTQWISHHIDHLTGIEKLRRSRYRRYLELDIDPVMGALPLSAVTETTVAQFIQALTDAKASGKTIKNKHGFLSGALQGCGARRSPRRQSVRGSPPAPRRRRQGQRHLPQPRGIRGPPGCHDRALAADDHIPCIDRDALQRGPRRSPSADSIPTPARSASNKAWKYNQRQHPPPRAAEVP
ncbi:hypothetical protein GS455_26780 [Rhodococcus hoagii]|nr:hypothetical protein [Prescottella equi]